MSWCLDMGTHLRTEFKGNICKYDFVSRSFIRTAYLRQSFQIYGVQSPPTCKLQIDMKGHYYSKAPGLAVRCSWTQRNLYDGTCLCNLHARATRYCVVIYSNEKYESVGVVGYEKVHKGASRVTRLYFKFTRFGKEDVWYYLYLYTLYSLSFGALKTLRS
jgi:hypothetical protein